MNNHLLSIECSSPDETLQQFDKTDIDLQWNMNMETRGEEEEEAEEDEQKVSKLKVNLIKNKFNM